MSEYRTIFLSGLLVLFAGALVPQWAQENATGTAQRELARRRFAIETLRSLNTAEVQYHSENGSFTVWRTLLSVEPNFFHQVSRKYGVNRPAIDGPAIFPGWNLRLNVHVDGQGYDVLFSDTTDQKCGYAALTDENGLIRESKAIDCED